MRRDRMPASRLASALPPTDSTIRPSAVRRVNAATSSAAASAIEDGQRQRQQVARSRSALYGPELIVMIWPSVISWAMPRPATMRISVAMIGWMPMTATRKPFHSAEHQRGAEGRGASASSTP